MSACNHRRVRYHGCSHVSLHAEVSVCIKYLKTFNRRISLKLVKNINTSTIFTVRLLNQWDNKTGNRLLGISLPCDNCKEVIYNTGIRNIRYTDIINGVNVLVYAIIVKN